MTVLITAATGKVAQQTIGRLLGAGQSVKLLVRNREKAEALYGRVNAKISYVSGAFDDPAILEEAFSDITTAFLGLGTCEDQVRLERGLIDAAKRYRAPHVIRLSALAADADANYEVARRHGILDAFLATSAIPATVLRPSYFMSNLLLSAASIAANGHWYGAIPTSNIAMIDARDVGDAAAAVILDNSQRDATYDLTGPEALTMADVAQRLTNILGRQIEYLAVGEEKLREGYRLRGVPTWLAEYAIGIERGMQAGDHSAVIGTLSHLTRRPARSLGDFIAEHRASFSPLSHTAA
jgi:uncharacterized protein YbjT (DUF2867 family)